MLLLVTSFVALQFGVFLLILFKWTIPFSRKHPHAVYTSIAMVLITVQLIWDLFGVFIAVKYPQLFETSLWWMQFIGILLIGWGLTLSLLSELALRSKKDSSEPEVEELVTRFPYNLIRHPMQVGVNTIAFGIFLLTQTWVGLLLWGVGTILLYFGADGEEVENLARFGGEYEEYKNKVPFWNYFLGIYRATRNKN